MNRIIPLAILLSGLAFGPFGCGGASSNSGSNSGVEPPHEGGGVEKSGFHGKKTAGGQGPDAPEAPIEPSPVPSLPVPGRMDPDKPDATRPGGLPSEDSKKEGPRSPEAGPGAPPAAPK